MADELTDYFERKFAGIETAHKAALASMKSSVDATAANISQTAAATLREVPERITAAFADGVTEIGEAAKRAERAGATLGEAGNRLERITRSHLLDHIFLAAIWVSGLVVAAGLLGGFYRWAKEPKIEERFYGCTGAYVAKTRTCKGKWIPLRPVDGP